MNAHLIRRDLEDLQRRQTQTTEERQQAEARTASDEHRKAEDKARAERLRNDRAIRSGLETLRHKARIFDTNADAFLLGLTGGFTLVELEALLKTYDYLDRVPSEAFNVPL